MPEYPDIELYLARLRDVVAGQRLERARFYSAFVLRSVIPPTEVEGRIVTGISRIGKRIVLELEDERFIVIHLMIAGRIQWLSPAPLERRAFGKILLASFRFPNGQLNLVEMSTQKRASIHIAQGRASLEQHRRWGLDVFTAKPEEFAERVRLENRTLKRLLTNPDTFDGIGNAYSDEILFATKLSPLRLTSSLTDEEIARLHEACKTTLAHWKDRLLELYPGFPKPADVTAFRPDFATHGRYGKPCPVCGSPIQHIVYAENETNYCAKCQNEGRLLADRSLSRLLKSDWPRTLEEMLN
ncbi:MAG TPA: DNA-formamidopyrimidine glycosylase family protein [Fimbriimonadaceae bacterium]|nr:DNA-formamidopyrimidine glycosylase family protein [Fimbriimonadaceae bacterium]